MSDTANKTVKQIQDASALLKAKYQLFGNENDAAAHIALEWVLNPNSELPATWVEVIEG